MQNNLFKFIIFSFILLVPIITIAKLDDKSINLKISKANLYIQTQQLSKAFEIIEELKKTRKNNSNVKSLEAEAYFHIGNWRKGAILLDKILKDNPDDEFIKNRKFEALKDYKSNINISYATEKIGDDRLDIFNKSEVLINLDNFYSLGAIIESDYLDIKNARRANGDIKSFEGIKTRYELYLSHINDDGNTLYLKLFHSKDNLGFGIDYTLNDLSGNTKISAFYRYPTWDFVETIIGSGHKSRISVRREHKLTAQIQLSGLLAYNLYGMDKDNNLAETNSFSIGATYNIKPLIMKQIFNGDTFLSFSYILDGEYVMNVKNRFDSQNISFNPIPAGSREVHLFSTSLSKQWTKDLYTQVNFGYSMDRLGGKGPSFDINANYKINKNLILYLYAGQTLSSEGTSNKLEKANFNLKWIF